METFATLDALVAKAARSARPPPRLSVSGWADRYRKLSPESSAEPGQWRTSRAEYQRGIMDAVSDKRIAQVVVMSSAQVGKTEIINNVVGYYVSQDPAPLLIVQPTLEMAEAWSKDRLAPMVRDTPVLTDLVADPKSRGSGNTLLHKVFPGGHITMAGANSSPSLASRPIRVVLLDEVDRYPASAGTEGDPVALAIKRTATFWNRRILLTSTPTVKGASRIEQAFEHSDQRRYHVPCPHCSEFQVLKWAAVQWTENAPESARIACTGCGALLDDSDRVDMVAQGEWRATAPFKGIAGFHLWEAYSPWRSLSEIVDDFLKAKPYPETLKTWINTTLGEVWEDQLGERIAGESLASRAEDYAQWTVPAAALLLTAGVDVQHDRLALALWAYGPGEEAWAIAWEEIFGSPADGSTWNKLDEVLARRLPHEEGGEIGITAACIDAGDGVTTGYVLDYCRARRKRHILAIKGQSQSSKPPIGRPTKVDVTLRGVASPGSALLWPVGSDTIKGWLMGRIRAEGMVHFPAGMPDEYYAQLTAERLVTKHSRGMARREWVKAPSARNEALDATVYAYAAAVYAGLKRANWAALKRRVMPTAIVSPDQAAPPAPAVSRPSVFPSRIPGGFVKGWKNG
jgi:phage terminase large subunit GpA-like protein